MDTMKDYLKSSGDTNFVGFVKGKKVAGKTGTAEKTKDILGFDPSNLAGMLWGGSGSGIPQIPGL